MPPSISVIIVTRNRPVFLRRALDALSKQSLPKEQYETIIIDDSTDKRTHALWVDYFQSSGIRYHHEGVLLGTRKGRDVGMGMAAGAYVAFMDDDVIPSPQWLQTILSVFLSDSSIACIGGKSDLQRRDLIPFWMSNHLLPYFGVLSHSPYPVVLSADKMLVGLNMSFKKEIAILAGGFNALWPGVDARLYSEDEVRIQQRINELGYRRFYHPDASVLHGIDPSRLRMYSMVKRLFWQGVTVAMFHKYEGRRSTQTFLRQSGFSEIISLFVPSIKNAFLFICFLSKTAGMLYGYMLPENYST